MSQDPKLVLAKYVPPAALDVVIDWMEEYRFQLKISKARSTKLGDYRAPHGGQGHRITVNHDLNPFAFLITFVHEVAHLVTWEEHKHRVAPHGLQWKSCFRDLIKPFMSTEVFPADVLDALANYMENPAAASCSDANLLRTLKRYNQDDAFEEVYHVEDLPDHAVFQLSNGMVFKKGEKLRKRYKCLELRSKRFYMVSGLAEAQLPMPEGQQKLF